MKAPSFKTHLSVLSKQSFYVVALLLSCFQYGFSQVIPPTFKTFQSISTDRAAPPPNSTPPAQRQPGYNPLLPNDPYREQNLKILKQGGMDVLTPPSPNQHKQVDEIYRTSQQAKEVAYLQHRSLVYQSKFNEYLQLNPNNFSIAKAIYLSESAWEDISATWEQFADSVTKYANTVKQLLKREGMDSRNNTAINYGVQKLFQQDNLYYDSTSRKFHKIARLEYDFNDPMGDKDWRNMFVSKLLETGKGQCHSLPLLDLCIVQELGGKAYIALAPSHSYILYFDEKGNRYNFETTNGHFISESWLMQSTGVNAGALKHGTYLDTLSSRKLYAYCLGDMLFGYVRKIGYDDISHQMIRKILEIDESNITALVVLQWHLDITLKQAARQANIRRPEQIMSHPVVSAIYRELMAVQAKLDNIGVQSMPADVYRQWLKSMNDNSQQAHDSRTEEKLLRELQKLKKIKPTFTNTPKK